MDEKLIIAAECGGNMCLEDHRLGSSASKLIIEKFEDILNIIET